MEAALGLFAQKGFEATTVQDITEAADAGKGTFFHHFPTKDHVLVAYWDKFNAELLDRFEGIRKRTARTRLLEAMKLCGEAASREPELGRALLGRIFTSPALLASDQANEMRLSSWLGELIRAGIERGELRANTDVDSFQHLIIANMSSTFRDHMLFGGKDPAKLLASRTRFLLQAVEVSK